jgi:LDH2 family malate/lactate/ureidoglycolate dehydrogenase
MLPPERLGVDVPFVGIILATFDPACTGPARLAARRFVSRLADVNLDEVPVHGVTEVVAHLTHALMAHLDGRLHEAKRALHCAGIVAEFLDAEPGLGHAAYVRAARLLHHHAPSQETP